MNNHPKKGRTQKTPSSRTPPERSTSTLPPATAKKEQEKQYRGKKLKIDKK